MTVEVNQEPAVEVEWALWGKEERDTEYRLLRSSGGVFAPEDLAYAIVRYSPGTFGPDLLPQVSFSWLRHPVNGQPSHLAIAIHETSADDPLTEQPRSRNDAAGREITFVRYFCAPFTDLAREGISYLGLYASVRRVMLHNRPEKPIWLGIKDPEGPPPGRADRQFEKADRQFAEQVAARLIGGRPVCILGAQRVPLDRRVRFLTLVTSRLTYGVRSQLSAATWVNSNYTEHKFRLFFAAVAREDLTPNGQSDGPPRHRDLVLHWNRPDSLPDVGPETRQYLRWAGLGKSWAAEQLSKDTIPVDLQDGEAISAMLGRMEVGRVGDLTVPKTLKYLSEDLASETDCDIPSYLEHLRNTSRQHHTAAELHQYRTVIRDYALLDERVPGQWRNEVYDGVLRVAVDGPLSYLQYRILEECANQPLQLHRTLLAALFRYEPAEVDASWLLIRRGLGATDEDLVAGLGEHRTSGAKLVRGLVGDAIEAQPLVSPRDGQLIIDPVIKYIIKFSHGRAEFRTLGYLAPALDRYFPRNRESQVKRLGQILDAAHGTAALDRKDIREILGQSAYPPTDALLAAVIARTPENTEYAMTEYGRSRYDRSTDGDPVPASAKTRPLPRPARPALFGQRRLPDPKTVVMSIGLITIVAAVIIVLCVLGRVHP